MIKKHIVIIGGGAAGYFLAANLQKSNFYVVTLLEKTSAPLQKVKISGGGRCNLTHACFNPKELVKYYPRGEKELLSVFYKFQPEDMMHWFESKNVELKVEDDNRVFPITNSSQTIINTLINEVEKNEVTVHFSTGVNSIIKEENKFKITTLHNNYSADYLIITTGSSSMMWDIINKLGHSIVLPLPSLFTFNIKNNKLNELMGIGFNDAIVSIPKLKLKEKGALLLTHWGLSGPTILRLSAWGAIALAQEKYHFNIVINWIGKEKGDAIKTLINCKIVQAKKTISNFNPFQLPSRFWKYALEQSSIIESYKYADLPKEKLTQLAFILTTTILEVRGKSTYKEEFVTCGGVQLKEIDFRSMQSKIHENLFFAGEVLNIDAITGGFNFQACWSESFLISEYVKQQIN